MNKIARQIEEQVYEHPEKTAIFCGEEKVSYMSLWKIANQVASSLLEESQVKSGFRVGIMVDQGIAYTTAIVGVLCAEGIMLPLNTHATEDNLRTIFTEVRIDALIISEKYEDLCISAGFENKMLVWEHLKKCKYEEIKGFFRKKIADKNAECNYLLTSGTTGHAKVVVLTTEIEQKRIQTEIDTFALTQKDCILIATPLYHCVGQRMILSALCVGAHIIFLRGYTPANWIRAVEVHKVTYTSSVPTQLEQIGRYVEESRMEDFVQKVQSIRILATTSSYLKENTKQFLKKYFMADLYNIYGSSESEWMTIADLRKESLESNSLGHVVAGIEIKIWADGKFMENGEVGEILCKGPTLMKQYLSGDVSHLWNHFYRTGDLGYLDNRNELHYKGRCCDMIICGGVNIYLSDIEKAVMSVVGVKDCKAYGIYSELFGELVGVDVVPFENVKLTEQDIKKHCCIQLNGFQMPRRVRIVPEISRNAMGKYQYAQETDKWKLK